MNLDDIFISMKNSMYDSKFVFISESRILSNKITWISLTDDDISLISRNVKLSNKTWLSEVIRKVPYMYT